MGFVLSTKIREKLMSKHRVVEDDIAQCFANRVGKYLTDNRENHATDPPTLWFISETDYGRKLKIVFVPRTGNNYIRNAFAPNDNEIRIYAKCGK
jgi:hypothetical protein